MKVSLEYDDCKIEIDTTWTGHDTMFSLWVTRFLPSRGEHLWELDCSYGVPEHKAREVYNMLKDHYERDQ